MGLVSGTKGTGRIRLRMVGAFLLFGRQFHQVTHTDEALNVIHLAGVDRVAGQTLRRETIRADLRHVELISMAAISGRGVMISRATLSPNSTTDCSSSRSPFSINPSCSPVAINSTRFSCGEGGSGSGSVGSSNRAMVVEMRIGNVSGQRPNHQPNESGGSQLLQNHFRFIVSRYEQERD